VTAAKHADGMPDRPAPIAVCILRVELESWGPVITMTVNRDIASSVTETVTHVSDSGEAVAAVSAFLDSLGTEKPS
jgi:hypothetical protein